MRDLRNIEQMLSDEINIMWFRPQVSHLDIDFVIIRFAISKLAWPIRSIKVRSWKMSSVVLKKILQ